MSEVTIAAPWVQIPSRAASDRYSYILHIPRTASHRDHAVCGISLNRSEPVTPDGVRDGRLCVTCERWGGRP